jgi:hypothetical protein
MSLELFGCLARAVLRNAPRALLGCLPFGEALYDVARDAMHDWRARRTPPERRAELEELASAPPALIRAQAEATAAAVARAPAERAALAGYLERLPGVVRRSLARPEDATGRTVPAGLPLDRAEDLVPLLPPRPPRFRPRDAVSGSGGRRWELLALVGNGGFGEVWRARPLPRRDGNVAIKVCLDTAAAKTLRTEAALLKRVLANDTAGGLVALRDACLEADPPFLVYDYVPGGDLTRLIRGWHPEGRRPARLNSEATRLIHCLAEILRPAHALHPPVVHRDLKPSNVLLEPTTPGRVRPRVADFGIGGVAARQALERIATTSQNEVLTTALRGAHTPLYASPQQLDGAPPDPRDDVYALGVLWYQVFTGDTTVGPPTDWRDELADRAVPGPLLDVLGRCLVTDPNRRPADAVALAGLLAPLLAPAHRLEESAGHAP